MTHLSSTSSQKREIMKRWLFIVLIFSVCFNQCVTANPAPQFQASSTNGALPPVLLQSASSSLFPSFFAGGPRSFFESIASTFGNTILSIANGAQALLTGTTEAVGSLLSSTGGTGRINSGNQRTSISQFQPLNHQNNGATTTPNTVQTQTPSQSSQSGSQPGTQTEAP
ncbi:uncharacterized protein LOC129567397 [Sitodiplosis mosellana]|uniref:uncharacterized protein LOC129567397 n=1 Tax=Sitodiplosis mosellana TaxID=263140 RepID=UPI002444B22A|nr:uncharacterized protein LOC129567397 [Sitodiplosis mosellana]